MKKKEKKVKHRKRKWWKKKCQELIISLSMMRVEKWKKGEEVKDAPKRGKLWGSLGSGSFSF